MQTNTLSCTGLSGVSHWPSPTDYSHKFSFSSDFLVTGKLSQLIKTAGASTRCSTREKSHTDVQMESDTRNSDILQVLLLHRGEAGKFAIPTTTKILHWVTSRSDAPSLPLQLLKIDHCQKSAVWCWIT